MATRTKRKPVTHCKHGHEFIAENTYVRPGSKKRDCRACHRRRSRTSYRLMMLGRDDSGNSN